MRLAQILMASCVTLACLTLAAAGGAARPNMLWITVEDMSANLGCYGDRYAISPHLDGFAREAVRYTRAFATAPVCSPARSCLITGVYATSLGTQRLRSSFPIPAEFKGFPAYLRAAGYHTSNNVKTDYNTANEPTIIAASWDACGPRASWRERAPGQPFFSVINLMTTHQSRTSVWSFEEFEREIGDRLTPEQRHDPAQAPLPPYYPDTPLARRTVARYYDCITRMDQEVGQILADLQTDGLAEDTIVFFYADHGMGMPRGKRVLQDTGLHVPLLIRFPEQWRRLAPAEAGQTVDQLVSFVDFPPTVLSLAELPIPAYFQGIPFLGPQTASARRYVFGARDRVDEADDVSRSVRDARWLYIRNYQPHLSWMQRERYSDQSAFRREFLELAEAGQLDRAQLSYANSRRAMEELYDTTDDPHQIHNLADHPEHQEVLERLRAAHASWVRETRDLGFLPEPEAWQLTNGSTPYAWARAQSVWPGEEVFQAASQVGLALAVETLAEQLAAPEPAVRYWAVTACLADPERASGALDLVRPALADRAASVRIQAATMLARTEDSRSALEVLQRELTGGDVNAVLAAARALERIGDPARPVRAAMETVRARAAASEADHPCWMFVRFALEEALERFDTPPVD